MVKVDLTRAEIKHLKILNMVNSNYQRPVAKGIDKKFEQIDYNIKASDQKYDEFKAQLKERDKRIRGLSIQRNDAKAKVKQLRAELLNRRPWWQKLLDYFK